MSNGQRLTQALSLRKSPVAIRFSNEPILGLAASSKPAPGGCSFWEWGTEAVFTTRADDHEHCAIGVHTHNLDGASERYPSELRSVLQVFNDMEYATEDDVARIPVMPERHRYVAYGPLDGMPGIPDVVLLFVDSRQSLVVAEAAQQVEGGVAPAMGRPACAIVPQVVGSGKAAVSLGCCGARAYLDVLTDDVALWALPGGTLDAYVKRIESLAHANDVLGQFHALRRRAVEAGGNPTYAESMAALEKTE